MAADAIPGYTTELLLVLTNLIVGWIGIRIKRIEKVWYAVFGVTGNEGLLGQFSELKNDVSENRNILSQIAQQRPSEIPPPPPSYDPRFNGRTYRPRYEHRRHDWRDYRDEEDRNGYRDNHGED